MRNAFNRTTLVFEALREADALTEKEAAYFVEEVGRTFALRKKPLHIHEQLRELIFENPSVQSVVVTSATMTTRNESFDFVAGELGAEDSVEMVAPSPFDFSKQAMLCVPKSLPIPSDKRWSQAVADVVERVATAADGRTLGLFTSYRMLNLVAGHLQACGWGGPCLEARDGSAVAVDQPVPRRDRHGAARNRIFLGRRRRSR
ncbi:MAG: hypothetical protein HC882_07020 [Acidobacteria bacterium]|nr:hypothetical protein [Acidobacteriota bacterium]